MAAITLNNVSKSYGRERQPAVDDVSFSVQKGELFGLIGPDGAGKTSLFRILTTLLLPDSGTGTIDGWDVIKDFRQIRNTVGYMPGRFSLYPDLTIAENLSFFATVFNTTVRENYHLIRDIYIQIEKFKDRRAGKLSGGMKQKLALCCALIHKPTVLFLDEPTTGVDPVSRKEFWEMLKRLKDQNITIMVSTPYMDEAVRCDRIALIQAGKLLSVDTPATIVDNYPEKLYAIKAHNMYGLLKCLEAHPSLSGSFAFGEYAHVSFKDQRISLDDIKGFLADNGMTGIVIDVIRPGIEDSFIKLMNT